MAKRTTDPVKKSAKTMTSRNSDKYNAFRAADKGGRAGNATKVGASNYSAGVAPRVGSGVKKGTVKVTKPSSVSSGWRPAKKKY